MTHCYLLHVVFHSSAKCEPFDKTPLALAMPYFLGYAKCSLMTRQGRYAPFIDWCDKIDHVKAPPLSRIA